MADSAVVALDIGILLRLSRLDVADKAIPCVSAHSNSLPLTYLGPTRMANVLPRHSMIWLRLRMTRSAGSKKSGDVTLFD